MEKTQWQKNMEWSLQQEAAGTATPGMMDWLANWRAKGSPNTQAGMANDGLTFGGGSGTSVGNTWDTSDVTNPGGITSVTDKTSGVGFHGNTDHFSTHTESGTPHTGSSGGSGKPFEPTSSYEPTEIKAATPFLDSYMRAREAAKAEGPATRMLKEYME
jgi:hypothetical protein